MTRLPQNEVKQRADTAYYERMFAMLQEVDIYQINELPSIIQAITNCRPLMEAFHHASFPESELGSPKYSTFSPKR